MARRGSLMRNYAPLFGYVYVPCGVIAFALGGEHRQAAAAVFTAGAFAFLWFLGSLHSRLMRYDPEGFFASIVVLGGASSLALQGVALATRSTEIAGVGASCAATVIIGSSLGALGARKVPPPFGWSGVAGGIAVVALGFAEAAADWTFVGSTFWASWLGFLVWVLVTATYLARR